MYTVKLSCISQFQMSEKVCMKFKPKWTFLSTYSGKCVNGSIRTP